MEDSEKCWGFQTKRMCAAMVQTASESSQEDIKIKEDGIRIMGRLIII